MSGPSPGAELRTLHGIRRLLLSLLLVAFVGTFGELVLLEHDEEFSQIIPLILLAAGTVTLVGVAVRPRTVVIAVFRLVMVLMIAGGALGLLLHFRANLEFQRDLSPHGTFGELFWKVMAAKAPPALAPAVLAQLGCLGLIYAYRLPMRSDARSGEGGGRDVAIQ